MSSDDFFVDFSKQKKISVFKTTLDGKEYICLCVGNGVGFVKLKENLYERVEKHQSFEKNSKTYIVVTLEKQNRETKVIHPIKIRIELTPL